MNVSLRPVEAADQTAIREWAAAAGGGMSRTRPLDEAADRHDPAAGLFWYVIAADGRDVGTVWVEAGRGSGESLLGIFIGPSGARGRGAGTAAVTLAVAAFRRAHPERPITLRVRRTNLAAVACYEHAGFTVTGEGIKSPPAGDPIPYYRMSLPGGRA